MGVTIIATCTAGLTVLVVLYGVGVQSELMFGYTGIVVLVIVVLGSGIVDVYVQTVGGASTGESHGRAIVSFIYRFSVGYFSGAPPPDWCCPPGLSPFSAIGVQGGPLSDSMIALPLSGCEFCRRALSWSGICGSALGSSSGVVPVLVSGS